MDCKYLHVYLLFIYLMQLLSIMGKNPDPQPKIVLSTTRRGTALSTQASYDSSIILNQLVTPPLAHTNEPHSKMSHDIDDGHDKTIDTGTTDSNVAESPLGELLDSHLAILKEKEILEYEPLPL